MLLTMESSGDVLVDPAAEGPDSDHLRFFFPRHISVVGIAKGEEIFPLRVLLVVIDLASLTSRLPAKLDGSSRDNFKILSVFILDEA